MADGARAGRNEIALLCVIDWTGRTIDNISVGAIGVWVTSGITQVKSTGRMCLSDVACWDSFKSLGYIRIWLGGYHNVPAAGVDRSVSNAAFFWPCPKIGRNPLGICPSDLAVEPYRILLVRRAMSSRSLVNA